MKNLNTNLANLRDASQVVDEVGELSLRFSRTFRLPRYPDGRQESDSEHSHMVAMLCIELAMRYHPEIDLGRVALLAVIHDIDEVETIGGDTPTLGITKKGLAAKKLAEEAGHAVLRAKYPFASNLFDLMEGYVPEADFDDDAAAFVFIGDKIAPSVTHRSNNFADLLALGITSGAKLWQSVAVTSARIKPFRERFPIIVGLRDYRMQQDADALDAMNIDASSATISR